MSRGRAPTRVRWGAVRPATALLVTVMLVVLTRSPAAAVTTPTTDAVVLELTTVDAVITAPDDEVAIVAAVSAAGGDGGATDVRATLRAHTRVRSRSELGRALRAASDGPPTAPGVTTAAADVPERGRRFVAVRATADELGISATRTAVMPLTLEVTGRTGDEGPRRTLARATTALVVATAPVARPVATSLLVRLDERTPRIDEVAAALADPDDPRATVAVAADAALAATSHAEPVAGLLASPHVERVGVPFAGADLGALLAGGLRRLADVHVALGTAAWPSGDVSSVASATSGLGLGGGIPGAAASTPTAPPGEPGVTPVVATAAPVGTATVAATLADRADGLVVAADTVAVDPAREPVTSPSPVRPLADLDGVVALVADPALSAILRQRPELGAADRQRVVAETAALWLERPGSADARGALLDPGSGWRPDPAGLARLLDDLAGLPWLELVGPRRLMDVTPAAPGALAPAADRPALSPDYVDSLWQGWEAASAAAAVLSPPLSEATRPPRPDALGQVRLQLLRAASVRFADDEPAGRRLIDDATTTATALVDGVRVDPGPTITLTDEDGPLPIVVRNVSTASLRVRVSLGSTRLGFPQPERTVDLPPESSTTVVMTARARAPGGTVPVRVVVTDPTGDRMLAETTVVVRIATYPGSALAILAAVALVLLGSWIRTWMRGRRAAGARVDAAAGQPPGAGASDHGDRSPQARQPVDSPADA